MGIYDWMFKKLDKKIKEEFPEDNENLIKTDEIEKESYSAYSYKNVKKLREKGKLWGVDVPYLQHPVKKQEKPRPVFLVLGIISAIVLALVTFGCAVFTIRVLLPLIAQVLPMNEFLKIQPWDIFGLFAMLTSMLPIFMWIIVIALIALVIGIEATFIVLTIEMFALSKVSMQEVAKGYKVRSLISTLGIIFAVVLIVGIVLLANCAKNMTPKNIAIVVGAMVVILAVVGTIFGLLMAEKIKETKEFEKLPIENQQDFIEHNRALERAKRKKNRDKSMMGSSEVDF